MRKLLVLALCVVALAAAVAWFAARPANSPDVTRGSAHPIGGPDPAEASDAEAGSTLIRPNLDAGRSEARSGSFRVLDSQGRPIVDAIASWSPELVNWNDEREWPHRDWGALEARSVVGKSNADGKIALDIPAEMARTDWRLWLTHVGHAARIISMVPNTASLPTGEFVLETDSMVRGLVLGADSRPAAGAVVFTVQDLFPIGRTLRPDSERRDGLYLVRSALTDNAGEVELPSLDGPQLCWAVLGPHVSPVVRTEAPDRITLSLAPQLRVMGRVIGDEADVDLTRSAVSMFALDGAGGDRIAQAIIRADGAFGPIMAPVDIGKRYTVQAQGAGFIAQSADVAQPTLGGDVFVELHVLRGNDVPIRVIDSELKPIQGAYASILWQEGSEMEKARGMSNAEGYAFVGRVPSGSVQIYTVAPGYLISQGTFRVEGDVQPYLEIELARAGILRGRVVSEGEPVRDFVLHFWGERIGQRRSVPFRGRKDGSFALENVEFGPLTVLAVSGLQTRSPEVRLNLEQGRDSEPISLELSKPLPAFGMVVDARTNEPIDGAKIQAWTSHGLDLLSPFGAPTFTDSSGKFELRALATGRGYISVSADQYAESIELCNVTESGPNDFGVIGMTTGSSLTIALNDNETLDPSSVECRLEGSSTVAPQRFSADRRVRFDGLGLGFWRVRIEYPGDSLFESTVEFAHEGSRRVDLPRLGSSPIEVEIIEREGARLPENTWLTVRGVDGNGIKADAYSSVIVPSSRRAVVDAAPSGTVHMSLSQAFTGLLAMKQVELAAGASRTVKFEFEGSQRSIRVLGPDREPLVGATVTVCRYGTGWGIRCVTDDAGQLKIPEVPYESVDLLFLLGERGLGLVRQVPLSREASSVVFDPACRLDLLVEDGHEPIPGCVVKIGIPDPVEPHIDSLNTDESGRLGFGPMLAAEYLLSVSHPTVWPNSRVVSVAGDLTSIRLDVRRRGSVVLTARRAGVPVAELHLDVRSVELAEPVSYWVGEGLASSSSAGFLTDVKGQLRLDGVPHGRYEWTSVGGDGAPVGGSFEVEPTMRVNVDLVMP